MKSNKTLAVTYRCTLMLTLLLAGAATAVAQYMPGNVVQPGDKIIASSGNSPGSEGVANAIDGTQSKYLNFDTSNGKGLLPSGFVVTPSVGSTWLSGIAIQTANDGPERDPKHFTIEGSSDDPATLTNWTSGTWTTIIDMTIPNIATRYAWQTFYFTNYAAFRNYRWTVIQTATANDCCMQVAEVQLLGASLPECAAQRSNRGIFRQQPRFRGRGQRHRWQANQVPQLRHSQRQGLAPSGFIVTPSLGDPLITASAFNHANDAPERDPKFSRSRAQMTPR